MKPLPSTTRPCGDARPACDCVCACFNADHLRCACPYRAAQEAAGWYATVGEGRVADAAALFAEVLKGAGVFAVITYRSRQGTIIVKLEKPARKIPKTFKGWSVVVVEADEGLGG